MSKEEGRRDILASPEEEEDVQRQLMQEWCRMKAEELKLTVLQADRERREKERRAQLGLSTDDKDIQKSLQEEDEASSDSTTLLTSAEEEESGLDEAVGGEPAPTPTQRRMPKAKMERLMESHSTAQDQVTASQPSFDPCSVMMDLCPQGTVAMTYEGNITSFTGSPAELPVLSEGIASIISDGAVAFRQIPTVPCTHKISKKEEPWTQSARFTRRHRPSEQRRDRRGDDEKNTDIPAHEQVD